MLWNWYKCTINWCYTGQQSWQPLTHHSECAADLCGWRNHWHWAGHWKTFGRCEWWCPRECQLARHGEDPYPQRSQTTESQSSVCWIHVSPSWLLQRPPPRSSHTCLSLPIGVRLASGNVRHNVINSQVFFFITYHQAPVSIPWNLGWSHP